MHNMRHFNYLTGGLALAVALFIFASTSRADGTNSTSASAPKPDLLKTCPVSGEKFGGDMGEPVVFVYQGQEVKLCCPMCKPKFDKDPDKYMKVIKAAEVKK